MSGYTDMLDDRAAAISPEDDDYEEQLLRTASLFRPFDKALDVFILRHGFAGDLADPEAKTAFLRTKFQEAGIRPPRGMRDWFVKRKSIERDTAFQLCFAFGLDVAEVDAFFREVYLERSFDCHAVREAVYYYCIRNGLDFQAASGIIAQIQQVPPGDIGQAQEILYTGAILERLNQIRSQEELIAYINSSIEKFGYHNATATKYIRELWAQIAGPAGLARLEGSRQPEAETAEDSRVTVTEAGDSVWNVYSQMLGLDRRAREGLEGDRSIKAVLRDNELLHPLAEASFPDRDGIHKALHGVRISNERVRKLLILLIFYSFWAKKLTGQAGALCRAEIGDADRCLWTVNRYLLDAGYPELYPGNPYDWIFLWALRDDYPLEAFRSYIGELFAVKSEQAAGN